MARGDYADTLGASWVAGLWSLAKVFAKLSRSSPD